jgi:SAM-dependent methyltransferase
MTSMIDLTSSTLFSADFYLRHNQRRLEHLASLGLDLAGKSVLEPGAGVGYHSLFYLDRGCRVTAFEPRAENCEAYRAQIEASWSPTAENVTLVEAPFEAIDGLGERFDLVHCYGFLYHVGDPEAAIALLARRTAGFMVLETCVSMDAGSAINVIDEPTANPAQAFDGKGCRPTRAWVMESLTRHFAHAYVTRTQPAHDEFPLDWTRPWPNRSGLTRAVFVGSHVALDNPNLLDSLPDTQTWG